MVNIKHLLLPFIYVALFFGVYYALADEAIYKSTLSNVVKPYKGYNYKKGGKRYDEPYIQLKKENIYHWDARMYRSIAVDGYAAPENQAFFPLFPLLFKLTNFSLSIIAINFLLFFFALLYLFRQLLPNGKTWLLLLFIASPTVFVFFLPYPEALFFFCFTIAIAGFLRGNIVLVYVGLILAACTKPIVTIVILSFLSVELIRYLQTKNSKNTIANLLVFIAPILIGTGIAAYIQYTYTGSFFSFIKVQGTVWQHTLRVPTKIADWSEEGHIMNVFTILFVAIPSLWYCIATFSDTLKKQGFFFTSSSLLRADIIEKTAYINLLSAAYVSGSFLFILFFQGGSLNGTFRYIMCTPFFYILLINAVNSVQSGQWPVKKTLRNVLWLTFIFVVWIAVHKRRLPRIDDLSYLILFCSILLFLYHNKMAHRWFYIAIGALVLFGLVYQTYLFQSFTANSWILT